MGELRVDGGGSLTFKESPLTGLATEDQLRTVNTIAHHRIHVQRQLQRIVHALEARALVHDESKYRQDEFDGFARINRAAREHPYGSPEYIEGMKRERITLERHFERNGHHPEHTQRQNEDGTAEGMGLLDLIECVCDWRAAWTVYDGQRDPDKRTPWKENLAKQKTRFLDTGVLSQEQWWVVEQVAAFLES